MQTRRGFLAAGLSVAVGTAGCSQPSESESGPPATTDGSTTAAKRPRVGLETVTDAPDAPLAFRTTSNGRAYIADRPGRVHLLENGSVKTALDLTDTVLTGSERGLLGLALHPEFASSGRIYIRYSASPRSGTPDSYSHTFVLAEFRAREDGTIDAASERTLLEIPEPQGNHNSGSVAFGPEGYLHVGVGDGGAGGDSGQGHVEDWHDSIGGGNGQDVTANLLGSLLRIDVDDRSGARPYGIPSDNPLVGEPGLDEHHAWGLRNPWGISFDGAELHVADVGQNRYEEVNRIERGGNYGWNVREGTHCFVTESCPDTTPDGEPLRDPVVEYSHGNGTISGVAVVGGHVYRGEAIPELSGEYVFGDLNAAGELFVATPTEETPWPIEILPIEEGSREKLTRLLALDRDGAGEIHALTPGGIHRIVPAE